LFTYTIDAKNPIHIFLLIQQEKTVGFKTLTIKNGKINPNNFFYLILLNFYDNLENN